MESFLLALIVVTAPDRILTLDEAVAVARAHQPQIAVAHAQTLAGSNQATFYFTQMLPQINGNAQYSRSTSNFAPSPGALPRPLSNTPTESLTNSANYFSFALNANQLIYDFGQLYYTYTSAQATALSLAATERSTVLTVTLTVRVAYFNARLQKALLKVAHDTLDNQTRHRDQIEAYVHVGKRPEIDLLQARTDYSTAHLQAINADANYLLAKAQLNQSMGIEGDIDYEVGDDSLPAQPYEEQGIDPLLQTALAQRPDYISLDKQLLAQQLALRAAMGAWGPTFTATAGVSDAGEQINDMAWNWRAGANMNWSIFGSGETYFAVQQNRWELCRSRSPTRDDAPAGAPRCRTSPPFCGIGQRRHWGSQRCSGKRAAAVGPCRGALCRGHRQYHRAGRCSAGLQHIGRQSSAVGIQACKRTGQLRKSIGASVGKTAASLEFRSQGTKFSIYFPQLATGAILSPCNSPTRLFRSVNCVPKTPIAAYSTVRGSPTIRPSF